MPLFNPSPVPNNNSITFMKNGALITDSNLKVIMHTVASTSGTTKTVDISSYGLTTLHSVTYSTQKSGTDQTNTPICHLSTSPTTSTITYQLIQSKTTGVLIGGSVEGLEYDTSTDVNVTFIIIGS